MPSTPHALHLPLGVIARSNHLELVLEGVRHAVESFLIFVYLNLPEGVRPLTPPAEPYLAGQLGMYGLGEPSHPGEALPQTAPFQMELSIPATLHRHLRWTGTDIVTLALACVDGDPLPASLLRFERIRIVSTADHNDSIN